MRQLKKHYTNRLNLAIVLSVLLLIVATALSGTWGLLAIRENSDALIQPLLFQSFQFGDTFVLGDHSLLIKWPLFFIQSILPYNTATFILVNLLLSLATVLIIFWVTLRVFGKKTAVLFSLAMSVIILSSSQFMYFFAWSAVRNIEYALSILLALFVYKIATEGLTTRKTFSALMWVLFILCVASDSLFLVILTAPVIATLGILSLLQKAPLRNVFIAAAYVISATLSGLLIQKTIDNIGVVGTFFDTTSGLRVIDIDGVIPSTIQSAQNILLLTGGDFYNKHAGILVLLYVLCLCISLIGVYWIVSISRKNIGYRKPVETQFFTSTYLSLSAIILVVAYIATSKAVTLTGSGYVDAASSRYLTLLPIIIAIGAAVVIGKFKLLKNNSSYLPLVVGTLLVIILCIPTLNSLHSKQQSDTTQHIEAQKSVVRILSNENVKYALTGYWYSGPIRFWSNEEILSVSVAGCNIAEPKFNNRRSWYIEHYMGKDRSAIVIDRSSNGFDRSYWKGCTDESLLKIFGKPIKIIEPSDTSVTPTIWIYGSDIRPYINSSNLTNI